MWNHTVAILIGGQSKRMGSPKHLVELPNGKTMLEQMLDFALRTADNVVISGGDVDGYISIHDNREKQGPVSGIEASSTHPCVLSDWYKSSSHSYLLVASG